MHVLILSSEEFVPEHNHALGIFQYHQAAILQAAGHKVGALSITQSFSIPMLVKSIVYKGIGRKTGNATDTLSVAQVVGLGYKKAFRQDSFIRKDKVGEIPVYRIDGFYYKTPSDANKRYGWVKAGMTAFKAYVADHGMPDIIHAHNAMYAGILAKDIKEQYIVPYVVTEHSTAFARNIILDEKVLGWIQETYNESESVYAVSQPFCDLLSARFNNVDFKCLPNVLDPYLESAVAITNESNNGKFIFLNIAELHPKKNQKMLLDAFVIIKQQYPHAELWIAGDGELRKEIEESIAEKGLTKEVTLLGLLNRDAVMQVINKAHCMVLPSIYETFGVVLIEAMLFGKPVIATKSGGPEYFVAKETGVLVENGNTQKLADAMECMIDSYGTYNAAEIRKYTIDRFGKAAFLKNIENVYKEAVSAYERG